MHDRFKELMRFILVIMGEKLSDYSIDDLYSYAIEYFKTKIEEEEFKKLDPTKPTPNQVIYSNMYTERKGYISLLIKSLCKVRVNEEAVNRRIINANRTMFRSFKENLETK